MEIAVNIKYPGISFFYRNEIKTDKGIHVGVVIDKLEDAAVCIYTYDFAKKRNEGKKSINVLKALK